MWGSEVELERKRRIDIAVYAYAYEVKHDTLIDDFTYDFLALQINPAMPTGNKKLDAFFKKEFDPCTGAWVNCHPDKRGLERIYQFKKQIQAEKENAMQLDLAALGNQLALAIDAHTAKIYDDGHRNHLGASQIGDACRRKLWYVFRWVRQSTYVNAKGEDHSGRMQRLFNRGHLEEFRNVEWLRGMGFTVEEFDPLSRLYYLNETDQYLVENLEDESKAHGAWAANDVSGNLEHQAKAASRGVKRKQLRISDCSGHYGGSLDAEIKWPASMGEIPDMLGEFKTANEKSWKKLHEEGVRVAKPVHYTQMCVYGKRRGFKYAIYICVNKNDDHIHIEIVELDWNVDEAMTHKAHGIITSATPPQKLHENSAHFDCKFCDFAPVCHGQASYEKNCRSCKFAAPIADGKWACAYYGEIPNKEAILAGCGNWQEAR